MSTCMRLRAEGQRLGSGLPDSGPACPARCTLDAGSARRHRLGAAHRPGPPASQHVAGNAGFVRAGTVSQYVPCAGQTFEDLRNVLAPKPSLADK
jgi:hypothetical protein